jgi:SAM-dependent methyltransferase
MGAPDLDAAFAAMRKRYEGWLAEHGPESSQAVGWQDPAMQALRFDLLAQVMEGEAPVAVADFGCGTGALFAHLAARETPPLAAYAGYDVVPAMVEAARAQHPDPRARFEVGTEVREEVDYVLASGALTLRPGIGDDDWEEHVRGVLSGLWERSRRGLAFNLLTRGPKPPEPTMYAGDPETWARWCSSGLPDARVALRYGPPLRDFTVLVRRAAR